MVIVQICVGSSCHLKGAPEIVALFEKSVKEQKLDDEVILAGSFCSGKCNRVGVTVTVNDEIFTGVTPESFKEFWHDHIVPETRRRKIKGDLCPIVLHSKNQTAKTVINVSATAR